MEPTIGELVFYIIAIIIAIIFVIIIAAKPDHSMEITWGQRRDWKRRERKWGK